MENEYTIKGEKVWEMDAQRYQYLMGVHQPWIAEISPAQYAGISKRARREYDKKRSAEWQASYDIKQEWYEKVTQAYVLGKFKLEDPGVSDAVKTAVWRYETDLKEEREKVAQEQARKENQIISVDELVIGDRVHSIMYREYGVVIKKFKKSVRIRWEKPLYTDGIQETTNDVGQLWWWSYNDMVERVKQSLPIRPDRFYAPPPAVPAAAPPPETEQDKILRELRTKYRFSRPEADTVNTAIASALVHRYVEAEDYNMVRRILEPVQDGGAIAEDLKEMVLGTYWQWPPSAPAAAPPPPPAVEPATELVEEDECDLTQQQIDYWKGVALADIREKNIDGALNLANWFDDHGCKTVADRIRELAGEPEEEDVPAAAPPPPAAPPALETLDEYIGIQKEETAVPEPPKEKQKTLEQYLNGG